MDLVNNVIPFFKAHLILTILWLGLLVAIIYLTIKSKLSKVKIISTGTAVHLMNKEDAAIIDTRNHEQFKKGHITGSINLLSVDIKNNSISAIEKFKQHPVIIVDDNGLSAMATGELLTKQGFTQLYALKDGIAGWNGENLPLVKK